MDFKIRPLDMKDMPDINEIRTMRGVMETITTVPSEPLWLTQKVYEAFCADDHMLVAETEHEGRYKVIACGGLHISRKPRLRHSAEISLIVNTKYQNLGVGKALMTSLLEIADEWLLLKRVWLETSSDNPMAIALYKSMGFEVEGIKKCAITYHGDFIDTVVMGRCK